MSAFTTGQFVSWDLYGGSATVRITSVTPDSISYVSDDGHGDIAIADAYISLSDITRGWRPATAAEAAEFKAMERPEPENWN
jgi:hypothetical protein